MTVQGSGGGRKVPPGAPPTSPAQAPRADDAKKPASTPPTAAPAQSSPPLQKDGFEATSDPRLPVERLATIEVATPSGVDSMVRVLEDTKAQILEEHKALRTKLSRLIAELVASRFDRGAFEERRADVIALRTRLAALRKRLRQIQRRLKTVAGRSRHADADLSKQLSTQLDKLRSLEPGLQRALLALQLMEAAFVDSTTAFKHRGVVDAEVGDALAHATPGQHVIAGVGRLLAEGAQGGAPTAAPPAPPTPTPDGLAALRDVAAALKRSFEP